MVKSDSKDKYIAKCQKYLLELLAFVDTLCRKNDIKYSLSCGTMLGAVREKGFIKWDDDADVIFTRDEYDKFIRILRKVKLPKYVGVYYPEKKKDFLDFNIRLFNKREIIRKDTDSMTKYDGLYRYAMLDLFVLDDIPEDKVGNRKYILDQQMVFGLAMSKRDGIKYKKYSFIEKVGIGVLSTLGRVYDIKKLCKMHNEVSTSYKDKKTNLLYCTSWSPEAPGYQYEKRLFSKYKDIKFENKKFMITKDYAKVLTIDYGKEYMKPKKTHSHDDFVTKL